MKIGCIVITYNPRIEHFASCVDSLEEQVDEMLVIDNGSRNVEEISSIISCRNNVLLNKMPINKGIALATNKGLNFFLKKNFDFVLISDQDTVYPNDYISNFTDALIGFNTFENIAAVVPIIFDTVSNRYRPCYLHGKIYVKKTLADSHYTSVFQAIASGMIINLKIYDIIGGMNEILFIDLVDYEWCWKAMYHNYEIICLKNLIIRHHLGSSLRRIGKKNINIRSNTRYYYLVRNSFFLSLYTKYLPFIYRIVLFFLSFRYIIGYPLVSETPVVTLWYCLRGMWDGINKVMGKIKNNVDQ